MADIAFRSVSREMSKQMVERVPNVLALGNASPITIAAVLLIALEKHATHLEQSTRRNVQGVRTFRLFASVGMDDNFGFGAYSVGHVNLKSQSPDLDGAG
jgi:hypothetical protein